LKCELRDFGGAVEKFGNVFENAFEKRRAYLARFFMIIGKKETQRI